MSLGNVSATFLNYLFLIGTVGYPQRIFRPNNENSHSSYFNIELTNNMRCNSLFI